MSHRDVGLLSFIFPAARMCWLTSLTYSLAEVLFLSRVSIRVHAGICGNKLMSLNVMLEFTLVLAPDYNESHPGVNSFPY